MSRGNNDMTAEHRRLVETALRAAIGNRGSDDQVTEYIDDHNLSRFVDHDGHVDLAKVSAKAALFTPTNDATPRGAHTP